MFHSKLIGQTIPVLFEGRNRHGIWYGRSPWLQTIIVPAATESVRAGQLRSVSITLSVPHGLQGVLA